MPFSFRVFCREITAPSLSDLLLWMRQFEAPLTIAGGRSAQDLLSSFWEDVIVSYDAGEPNLVVRCLRADAIGMATLRAERDDFLTDIDELAASAGARGANEGPALRLACERVREHLLATQSVVVIEFEPEGVTFQAREAARGIMTLFVERAGGMPQRDGIGFFDEEDDVLLKLG